jgi:tyrosinase
VRGRQRVNPQDATAELPVSTEPIRIRRDVSSLKAGDDTLSWYARGVARMQTRPLEDPTSWEYQAAIHGREPKWARPGLWNQCQHGTWFFLPWHRGYLGWFEQIVIAAIRELDGPSNWALPYWNYSDGRNPEARKMPPAFLATPTDGTRNPLRVEERNSKINGGGAIDARDVKTDALDVEMFEGDLLSFGGGETGFEHAGGNTGALENRPHNAVHRAIGGHRGFMNDTATAALDPIFWLHHANIDRMWEIWRRNPRHDDPTSSSWLDERFKLHDAVGRPVTFSAAEVLDTQAPPLSYVYDCYDDPRMTT